MSIKKTIRKSFLRNKTFMFSSPQYDELKTYCKYEGIAKNEVPCSPNKSFINNLCINNILHKDFQGLNKINFR